MKPYWQTLGEKDRDVIRTLMAFLNGRLAERSTIEWALKTTRNEFVTRNAILQLLELTDNRALKEPWRTAWRLIEESWNLEDPHSSSIDAYRVQRRIVGGERTGSLISSIVSLVRPRLQIEARSEKSASIRGKRARRVEDLFRASLHSHELVAVDVYRLAAINEVDFLVALANALEGAVNDGIAIGRRLGWNNDHTFWRLGQLYSVSYQQREDGGHVMDVDQFRRGIAPSVKLLHAAIERLSAIDASEAKSFVEGWKQTPTPIYLRLWASLSRIPALASSEDLSAIIPALGDREFWDVHSFPEIAELRACRFGELSQLARTKIEFRISKGPPRNFWPKDLDSDRVQRGRAYWAVREYRRIEVAGAQLSKAASAWLAQHIGQFQDLEGMASVRFGFLHFGAATWARPQPDARFNELEGESRLRALEAALATAPKSWDDDPAERASDWIQEGDNAAKVLTDLEAAPRGGAAYPDTWGRLGWSLKAPNRSDVPTHKDVQVGDRMLRLLTQLPDDALQTGIQGISVWMSTWAKVIAHSQELEQVWTRLWPLSVQATNAASVDAESVDLNEIIAPAPGEEPDDLDTLNVPVGRLIDVFITLCPKIVANENPFDGNELLRTMRNLIISAEGKAGLIGRHRLVEELPYFLNADEQWARENLVAPLDSNDDRALALWRAIARRTQFRKVLEVIGDQVAARSLDRRLGREKRGILLSSLVIESLHSYREERTPAVPNAKVQQTLRAVDDEVRANAAQTVQRYLSEMAGVVLEDHAHPAEEIFRTAVVPFLKQVWPQERSLATRGVSAAFAHLPASAGQAFAEAVDAVDPFLVPFDCWSTADFGLWGEADSGPRLSLIDTPVKAAAFLRLLDLTIGASEGSVVPMDLAEAIEQIQKVSQQLIQDPVFRRLATVARRR